MIAVDFMKCECDLTLNGCDEGCCCDKDCSADVKKAWSQNRVCAVDPDASKAVLSLEKCEEKYSVPSLTDI
jgi:hypothetical protein